MCVFSPIRIMLVEEDRGDRKRIISSLLEQDISSDICMAETAEESLEYLCSGNGCHRVSTLPDVILLDVIMPIMDGHEMLEALRKQPGGDYPSVIMLTARSQTQDIARANACGIDDYIVKPFDLSELLEKIEVVIENRKAVAR